MFNIIEKKKLFFTISLIITAIGIISFAFQGLNYDIDFLGGTEIKAKIWKDFENDEVAALVSEAIGETPSIQKATETTTGENTNVIIKTSNLDGEQRTAVYNALREKYRINITEGTLFTINMGKDIKEDELAGVVEKAIEIKPTIGKYENTAFVKTTTLTDLGITEVKKAITNKYKIADENDNFIVKHFTSDVSSENFSPAVGADLRNSALWAALIAIILMLIYISFRFEFLSSVAVIIALVHVAVVLLSIYSVFRIPVNLTFVAAFLTVIGYSTNDSIVVFDRIRENLKLRKKETIAEVVNASVWQTMRRSLLTGATTLITIIMLYILGVPAIREFALPMIIGIVFAIYSSIFIAAQLWVQFVKGETRKA